MDYNTIINEINNNVLEAIKISLRPLWEKIEQQTMNYQTIVGIMRNMPEFKELQDENIRLKEMLNKEKEMTHAQSNCINLEVIENRTFVDEDKDKINDKVKLIYSDVKLIPKENSVHVRNVCPDAESSQEDEVSEAAEEEEASEADQEASEAAEEEAESEAADEVVEEASEEEEAESEAADEVVEEASEEEEIASEAADEVVEEASEEEAASEAAEEEIASEADQEAAASESADEVVEASSEAAEEESEEEDAPAPTQERSATSAEEEEEVFIVEIEDFGDVYTNDENNGIIYKIDQDDDVGEKIGYFKDGVPVFENV